MSSTHDWNVRYWHEEKQLCLLTLLAPCVYYFPSLRLTITKTFQIGLGMKTTWGRCLTPSMANNRYYTLPFSLLWSVVGLMVECLTCQRWGYTPVSCICYLLSQKIKIRKANVRKDNFPSDVFGSLSFGRKVWFRTRKPSSWDCQRVSVAPCGGLFRKDMMKCFFLCQNAAPRRTRWSTKKQGCCVQCCCPNFPTEKS